MELSQDNILTRKDIKLGVVVVLVSYNMIELSEGWLSQFTGPITKLDDAKKVISIDFENHNSDNRELQYRKVGLDPAGLNSTSLRLITNETARRLMADQTSPFPSLAL